MVNTDAHLLPHITGQAPTMKTTQPATCPLCGEGRLHEKEEHNAITYEGVTESIPMYFSVCDACGSDQAGDEESRRNKRTILAFRKRVDGFLTGAEIRAMRQRRGITQQQAAKIFGGGPVAFSKYENDDLVPSDAMNKLLRVADAVPGAFYWLSEHAGMTGTATQVKTPHTPRESPPIAPPRRAN